MNIVITEHSTERRINYVQRFRQEDSERYQKKDHRQTEDF